MENFIGQVMLFGGNFAPKGWAFCHGQLLSIQHNSALFALLGTTYGGDGVKDFALPDLRGRMAMGFGHGPGLSDHQLGAKGGVETVTLTADQMPRHNHPAMASGTATSEVPTGALWAPAVRGGDPVSAYGFEATDAMSPNAIGTSGYGQPHDNMPPYLTMNYIIALDGIFPPRE